MFRGDCPHCKTAIVLMDHADHTRIGASPPMKGDAIVCDACGFFGLVLDVAGDKVKFAPLVQKTKAQKAGHAR